jgi:serine/threonine-protein phosphatase 6 regulatory ankyrin repeat subunit B
LADAAKLGDREAVRTQLNGSAKIDVAGPEGTAALIRAAERNDVQMIDLLLGAGTNPKGANEYGATALYAAAGNADPAVTEKLLAAGADANAALVSGETPLMVAARRGNLATVRALLSAKADPNAQEGKGGQTALMWAISERHSAVAEELLRHGADVNARSKTGFTALMFAAQQGDVDATRILLDAKASPNDVIPKSGATPLIIASAIGHPDVVALLLDKGADPNAVDANGFTSLHHAVRDSDYGVDPASKAIAVTVAKTLLAHGANPNARLQLDKEKMAAERKAQAGGAGARTKRTAITITEIELEGATPLALAAEVNNLEAVKVLVEGGADPRIATEQGTTPLILASGAGTDVQRARSLDERAMAVQTARYLLDHGVDVNAAGQFGWTALHSASYQGLNDVVELLVSKGAKVDAMDGLGQTPLSISLSVLTKDAGARRLQIPRRYRAETAELLLKLGATPLNKSGVVVVLQRNGDLVAGE